MVPANADRDYRGFSLFTCHVLVVMVVMGLALLVWQIAGALLLAFIGVLLAAALRGMAFLLGVIARILEFIPFIGPVVSAIPGILIAFTHGWTAALYALLVYIIVQQAENHLLIPLIQRKAVEVPPRW